MIWRRRKSVVDPKQQIWFGLEIVFVAVGFIILCAFLLFVPPMSDWLGGDQTGGMLFDDLNRFLLIKWPMICVAAVVLFVIGVLMAHRLSGPMKGLGAVLSAWASGDRKARVHFRRYDYILPMMEPLNAFLDGQEQMAAQASDLAQSVVRGANAAETKKKAEDLIALLKKPGEAS
jgi:methyl-accepting chemotaxis protein